ncbi:MAG: ATP-binding protein [Candidatus Zixiibacteriota bacterium]
MLHFASDALSTVGHCISSTSNPQEALRLIGSEKIDFLLTDIKMPDMDGITLAKKALETDPEIGILFMTGYADVETAKKAIATGAYDYIMKPFELSEIRNSVNAAVVKRKDIQKKQGSKGLQHLSELMGALYTTGDVESLTRLILRFALFHFGLKEGLVLFYNKALEQLQIVMAKDAATNLTAKVDNFPISEFPSQLLEGGETECSQDIDHHPFFSKLVPREECAEIVQALRVSKNSFCTFSLPATEKLKLVLVVRSDGEMAVNEADRQMLTVLLSLSSISLDNLILLQEAQDAMSRLEDFKDHLVGLERVATQGMMSSEIAHELNNFIAIILSNVELFEMKAAGTYPEASCKYLDNVKKNIGKFEKFTNSLSDAGKLDTKRQNSDLNEMINEIAAFARHQKRFRKIAIDLVLDSNLPHMLIDQSQIQQVLYNMINNAADAIGDGRSDGRIKIATKYDAEKHEFILTVADNGCGFSPENLQKAFRDRFTTKENGHGFGLTVIRKVIRNHGGTIVVDSQPDSGANIIITVPIADPTSAINSAQSLSVGSPG